MIFFVTGSFFMKRLALCTALALIFLEWLDFTLYLYLAKSVFAKEFFPHSSKGLMLSFILFAIAYCARPVGGWLFGGHADKMGRKKPMMWSAALMGIATLGMCVLPTYNHIGLFATFGLLTCRVLQSLALGGEINTAAMFIVEHTPYRNALFAGSLVAASGAAGMFLGGLISSLLQASQAPTWRQVFFLVGLVSLLVCFLRKSLTESPEFERSALFKMTWEQHHQGLINIALVAAFVSMTVYICNVFWVSCAIDAHIWRPIICTSIGALTQLSAAILAIILASIISVRQVNLVIRSSMLAVMITGPVLFFSTFYHYYIGIVLGLLGYVVSNGLICTALFYFLYLQLPAHHRCQGVSVVWALAASIGTLSLPLAELAVKHHQLWWPGLSLSLMGLLGLMLLKPTHIPMKPVLRLV